MANKTFWQVLNLLSFAGTLTLNGLANGLPINGKDTGQLSDQYPNLFTPAGITFAIWGFIYLLLAIFCGYQARDLFSRRKKDMPFLNRIGPLFVVSNLANMAWILAWHYEHVGLSLLLMGVLLGSLLLIYLRLETGRSTVRWQEQYFVRVPFSVYLGWISVATIANSTAWLVDLGWRGSGVSEQVWAVLVVGVATLLALFMLAKRRDRAYGLVILWALAGILLKRTHSDEPASVLIVAIVVGMLLVATGAVVTGFRRQGLKNVG